MNSSRGPAGIQGSSSSLATPKKSRGGVDEEEDLTQGMEDPPAEPRIIEVVASPANPPTIGPGGGTTGGSGSLSATGNKKQDSELQPLKSGNMADLDEPIDGTRWEISILRFICKFVLDIRLNGQSPCQKRFNYF